MIGLGVALAGSARDAGAQARDLAVGLAAVPTSVDPHFHDSHINRGIAQHVFDRLVHQDHLQRLTPGLATSWRMLDDRTWEFALRRGVRFHDGSAFDAADVIASLRRAPALRNNPASYGLYTRAIERVEAPDPFALRIRTTEAWPLLAHDLMALAIVPRAFADAATADFASGRAMIGTGPFRFAGWTPGEDIRLEGNPDWWGGAVPWRRVKLEFLPNANTRVVALTSGRVQLINVVPANAIDFLSRDGAISLQRRTSNQVIYLQIDVGRAVSQFVTDRAGASIANPLRDARVRRALSLAINRAAFVERLLGGLGAPASGLLPDDRPSAGGRLGPPRYDLEEARALLAAAGHGAGFALTLHGASDNIVGADALLAAIAAMLARIEIDARVEVMPRALYAARAARGEFSLSLFQRSFPTGEPSNGLRSILATNNPAAGTGTLNRGGYSNPELDAITAQAMTAMDEATRERLLFQATRIALVDDVAIIPLYHPVNVWGLARGIAMTPRADDYTLAQDARPIGA